MTPQEVNNLKLGDVLEHEEISFLFLIAGMNKDYFIPQDKKYVYTEFTIEEIAKHNDIVENVVIRSNENRYKCVFSRYDLQYGGWKLLSKQEEEEML